MNPFFFGYSSHPLYGVYHSPSALPHKKEAILLCPPFGQEYMRSHRAYRQLAFLLNKLGFPVLRFDYRGTGDSFGYLEDTAVSDWLEDINVAAEELKQTAQVDNISIVGLRLGGLLACVASEDLQINRLVLWDTITSGKDYQEELNQEIADSPNSLEKFIDKNGTLHFNGFALSKNQLQDLYKFDLHQTAPSATQIIQISSAESPVEQKLKSNWASKDNVSYQLTPAPGDWNYVDDFGGILLPQEVIQEIVKRFDHQEPDT
ncbi:MAG: esterase/lipase [Paraglaciecola sp.]|jgi:esterase/lipase